MPEQSYRPVLTPTPAATAPIQPAISHVYGGDPLDPLAIASNAAIRQWGAEDPSVLESALERAARRLYRFLGGGQPAGPMDYMLPASGTVGKAASAIEPTIAAELRSKVGEALQAVKQKIRAYHGSPHDFDAFSMEKIGTGEGAQAYGHGLYFAEREGTAKEYRDSLSAGAFEYQGQPVDQRSPLGRTLDFLRSGVRNGEDVSEMLPRRIKELRDHAAFMRRAEPNYGSDAMYDRAANVLESLDPKQLKTAGRMYEVEIDAAPDDLLDWDKPLSQQSEKVKAVLRDAGVYAPSDLAAARDRAARRLFGQSYQDLTGADAATAMIVGNQSTAETGREAYQVLSNRTGSYINASGSPGAAVALEKGGVKGIRYLDQGSRTAGEGTHNYVVFDDKLITILRKYGIAGAIGAGYTMQQIDQAQKQAQVAP